MSGRRVTKADRALQEELARFDELTSQWVEEVGWREQLNMLSTMSTNFAGRRVNGPGAAELKMLILRQRNLIDRWIKQAYLEGILAGMGKKLTPDGRLALVKDAP